MKRNNCICCKVKNVVTSDMFCLTIHKLESSDCLIEFGISFRNLNFYNIMNGWFVKVGKKMFQTHHKLDLSSVVDQLVGYKLVNVNSKKSKTYIAVL